MDPAYFCHASTGRLVFDPPPPNKTGPYWAILACDKGIVDFYSWLLRRNGIEIEKGSTWGPHISVVKGEEPPNKVFWGSHIARELSFRYTNVVRWDNGYHAWLDCWSEELNDVRRALGLPDKPDMSFHLTLGRLKT